MSATVTRPSDGRRKALKDEDNLDVPMISSFFDIDKYYETAEKVLFSFEEAFAARRLDDAYIYGRRFSSFSIDILPQHSYYKSKKYASQQSQNKRALVKVLDQMEQIAKWMDAEELIKQKELARQREIERKRLELERRRQEELDRQRLLAFQNRFNQEKHVHSPSGKQDVGKSALDKLKSRQSALDKLNKLNGGPRQQNGDEDDEYMQDLRSSFRKPKKEVPSEIDPPTKQSTETKEEADSESTEEKKREENSHVTQPKINRRREDLQDADPLPPPLPPPLSPPPPPATKTADEPLPPPPSYTAAASMPSSTTTATASADAPLPPPPSYNAAVQGKPAKNLPTYANRDREREQREKKRLAHKDKPTARQLRDRAFQDYRDCQASGRIQILPINTYQGRFSHSTNGCAVISPLVVSCHLKSRTAVSDDEIVDVIDRKCGPVLREIRGKLDLGGHALIIPSDVHDHLIDKKLLSQDSFVGATGGNIMDRKHISEFLRLMESGENKSHKNLRTGGALFFREHVVSVVKVPAGGGKFYFDLVDSLPRNNGKASRTRCRDLGAFETLIRFYSSSKFSDSNFNYMDKNDWDDSMADFDPRVFQGFVWGDPAKQ